MITQPGVFDLQGRYEKLSEQGDPLEALSVAVDFEQFRDRRYKLIRREQVTSAAVHDSQCFTPLLDKTNSAKSVWADSAYRCDEHDRLLERRRLCNRIDHRRWQGQSITEAQEQINRRCSSTRARVEHVFAHQVNSMNMTLIRTIGMARARLKIGIANLSTICSGLPICRLYRSSWMVNAELERIKPFPNRSY